MLKLLRGHAETLAVLAVLAVSVAFVVFAASVEDDDHPRVCLSACPH